MFNPDKVRFNYQQLTRKLQDECTSDNVVLSILMEIKKQFDQADVKGDTKFMAIGGISFVVVPVPNSSEVIVNMYAVHWRDELKCTETPFATITLAAAHRRIVGLIVSEPVPS
jgi:hypothetical protein